MKKRLGTAILLLIVVFGDIFGLRLIDNVFVDILAICVSALGVYEMHGALKIAGYQPIKTPLVCGVIAIYPFIKFLGGAGSVLTFVLISILALTIFTFSKKFSLQDLFATIFIILYPLIMFSPFFELNNSKFGLLSIMLILFVPIMTDTMAYCVGSTIKGPKLCPTISPKKTISGAVGGIIGGIIGAMIVFVLFDVTMVMSPLVKSENIALTDNLVVSGVIYFIVGLVGAVMCEIGDLGASCIKRKANIKDFGKIFPGHGGMMDRLDSILFMIPIVYLTISIIDIV